MPKCPNCGQPTARTKDWACPWCGYPLISKSYKEIPKSYQELRVERQRKWEQTAREETEASLLPPIHVPEPEAEVKPAVIAKPRTELQLMCDEAMSLVKDRPHLRLYMKGAGFEFHCDQGIPWNMTLKGGYNKADLTDLITKIKALPVRG